jgi:deoxyribodipyrimidine photo-lyase
MGNNIPGNAIFWHRRDFRIEDNAGLYQALKASTQVQPVFIFDKMILDKLPKNDKRVQFIHQEICRLQREYNKLGSDLKVFYGNPIDIIPKLCSDNLVNSVYTNRDYEPYALSRDTKLLELLSNINVSFKGSKDHVIFDKNEVVKNDGKPYTIFTPYKNKWKEKLSEFYLTAFPNSTYTSKLRKRNNIRAIPSLAEMGFLADDTVLFSSRKIENDAIEEYEIYRDIPSIIGTSRLGIHLRFGTISIRELARYASKTNETFLNELIWRDFYQMIAYQFPHSILNSFKPKYDFIEWKYSEVLFDKWCKGETGYPLVDAGMRELNSTGFMHNRVRMVVASFLCKHLLIDWRWGEAYFAEKLLDFDLASNVGGWQWAAGSGCDAAPYFRVFNPTLQLEKFDRNLVYVKKWVPEIGTKDYPSPIVVHTVARDLAIQTYKSALL